MTTSDAIINETVTIDEEPLNEAELVELEEAAEEWDYLKRYHLESPGIKIIMDSILTYNDEQ